MNRIIVIPIVLLFLIPCTIFSQIDETVKVNLAKVDSIFQLNLEEGFQFLDSLIAINPLEVEYYEKLKRIYEENKYYDLALSCYGLIIEIDPKNPLSYLARADFLKRLGQFENSIRDYTRALSLSSGNISLTGHLYNNRGTSKIQLRDYEGAYEDFSRSIQIDSTKIHRLSNFGGVLISLKKYDEALELYEKIMNQDSLFMGGYGNLGFLHNEIGNYTLAIEYFDKAIELESNVGIIYNNRGFSKFKLGNHKEALKDINKSLKLQSNNAYAYKNRALVHLKIGKEKEACEDLRAAKKLDFTRMYGDEVENLIKEWCSKI